MKTRNTARLLVLDPDNRLLLIKFKLPDRTEPFWATVGGAIEEGESFEEALWRELREETGVTPKDAEISGCIWFGEHDLEVAGEVVHFHERFAVARVSRTELCTDEMTDDERQVYQGHRWWTLEEISSSEQTIYPNGLGDLLEPILIGGLPTTPIEVAL